MLTILHTSAHELVGLANKSVHMIATSPPYFGLRTYAGDQAVEWPAVTFRLNEWTEPLTVTPWRGGLGAEPSPPAYIAHLILCLREWWRVLRDDGVCFVNLADTYAANRSYQVPDSKHINVGNSAPKGLKAKDLIGIPWLFAVAARSDGWYLRSEIVWAKGVSFLPNYSGNVMPESVTDRPTRAHEMVFMLTKSARYYYDNEAVKEASTGQSGAAVNFKRTTKETLAPLQNTKQHRNEREPTADDGTRNLRDVWAINTKSYAAAHYAVWPEKLVEPMVKAGSKIGDIVLDPFAGSGTTGKVAIRLGRRAILCDISDEYLTEHVPTRTTVQMEIQL